MTNGQRVRRLRKEAAKDVQEHEKLKQIHERRRRRQARMNREQR